MGLLLLFGIAACGLYFVAEAHLLSFDFGFPLDDSWIHLQFARQLAGGNGLAYNPGEQVTGSTAPLWTALLAPLFLLPGNVVLWSKALGLLLYLAGIHAAYLLARELGLTHRLCLLAAGLTLSTSWLVWSALSGMEIPLFILLSLWGLVLHARERGDRAGLRRPPLSLGLFGLSALARPEGALLLVLAVGDRLLVFRRSASSGLSLERPPVPRLALGLLLAACALAGTAAVYLAIGGNLLPTTFAAKGSGIRRMLPELGYLRVVLGLLFPAQPWMTILSGAGALVLIERLGGPRDRGLLPALWLVGLPLAYSLLSPLGPGLIAGNFGRYYFPLFPILTILGVVGLQRAAEALRPGVRLGRTRLPLAALAAVVVCWPTVSGLVTGATSYAKNVGDVQDSDVRMARFLSRRLPPQALLAINDIGALKYFLPNPILDLVGIVNPESKRFVAERTARGVDFEEAVGEFLALRQPDYLIIFPSWLPAVAADPRFRPVYYLPIHENRTMGGNEIVVYSTPWTRYPLAEPAEATPRPGDPIPVPRQGSPPTGEGEPDADSADRSGPR